MNAVTSRDQPFSALDDAAPSAPLDEVMETLSIRLDRICDELSRSNLIASNHLCCSPATAAAASAGGAASSTSTGEPPLGPPCLSERLQTVAGFLKSRPQLQHVVDDITTKLQLLHHRNVWILSSSGSSSSSPLGAAGSSSSMSEGQRKLKSENEACAPWDALYEYRRNDYLADVSLLKTCCLSPEMTEKRAKWNVLKGQCFPSLKSSSSGGGGSGCSPPDLLPAVVQQMPSWVSAALHHNACFQVDGETKTLSDLASLMEENAQRTMALQKRWMDLRAAYEDTVTWVNRSLCKVDMELEVAENYPTED